MFGDFNTRVDDCSDWLDVTQSLNLGRHVSGSRHNFGHMVSFSISKTPTHLVPTYLVLLYQKSKDFAEKETYKNFGSPR